MAEKTDDWDHAEPMSMSSLFSTRDHVNGSGLHVSCLFDQFAGLIKPNHDVKDRVFMSA